MSRNSCILSLLTWSLLDDDSSIWHSSQQDGFLRQNFKQVLPELLCQISMCLFVFTLLTFNPKSGELKTGEYNNRWIISALELFTNLERCPILGFPVQGRHQCSGGLPRWAGGWRARATRRGWGIGLLQPLEEENLYWRGKIFLLVCSYLMGWDRGGGGASQALRRGTWWQGVRRWVPDGCKTAFLWESYCPSLLISDECQCQGFFAFVAFCN